MNHLTRAVQIALEEDTAFGDITTELTVSENREASGRFLAKSDGVISGLTVAAEVFSQIDPRICFRAEITDGEHVHRGDLIGTISGPARGILLGERVALNFLQRLSGVATATAQYIEAVRGTSARIIDTRKTTPGMRLLEKAAVRDGGGHNHRIGLGDGILIKDNHLAAVGGATRISDAVRLAKDQSPHTLRVEVEVTNLDELDEALAAGPDAILVDNMSINDMAEAVRRTAGRAILEASGGITLETARAVAETGVDLISVGALTHSSRALDISLDFELAQEQEG
ncbi:MAG: carboxylating nicotinate-nucleotide diphosphorylase [Nitrolancea sp.]